MQLFCKQLDLTKMSTINHNCNGRKKKQEKKEERKKNFLRIS